MNALDFLDFILEKHHEGEPPEKECVEINPLWDDADFVPFCDGCELICVVDK